jgi:hypothetical protein
MDSKISLLTPKELRFERDFYWINPQSVVIPKGKLQEKMKEKE